MRKHRSYQLFENDIPSEVQIVGDIAIDTEALGLNLKRDRLCLVQICDSAGSIFLIKYNTITFDSPNLVKLLQDENRVKIFHYGRFDISILMHSFNINFIAPIFCTKIASKLTRTYTDSHGLKTICRELLGEELNKESQSSDWSSIELTNKQIQYAINDVIYLHKLRDIFIQKLKNRNRLENAVEYFKFLNIICKMDLEGFNGSNLFDH